MIANSRCIACILSKQERKIRKNSDEQKKKEYIHKVLKILYEYGTKECAPMVEKRIKDIYKEYYEEDVDYAVLKHRYNQYMLEKEEEIRAHIQKNNDIETCIKYVCAGNYIDFGVANKIDVFFTRFKSSLFKYIFSYIFIRYNTKYIFIKFIITIIIR